MQYVLPDWRVIDFHAHFPVNTNDIFGKTDIEYLEKYGARKLDILKRSAASSQKEWRRAWAFPDPESPLEYWQDSAGRWAQEVERYNLEKIIFVTGGGNEQLQKIIACNPDKFIGFAHHDPEEPDAANILEKAIIQFGFRGYKIIAPTVSRPLVDKGFKPIWEMAERYQIPILIHFGVLGGGGGMANGVNINPLSLHDVAKGYPGISFVVPHFGCGYPRELLHLCWVCANVHVDTSGNNEWVRWMPYDLNLEGLFRKFYETVGSKRIVFGSDSEWFPRGFAIRYLLDQLRVCHHLRLPETEIKSIFRDNALGLLKMN